MNFATLPILGSFLADVLCVNWTGLSITEGLTIWFLPWLMQFVRKGSLPCLQMDLVVNCGFTRVRSQDPILPRRARVKWHIWFWTGRPGISPNLPLDRESSSPPLSFSSLWRSCCAPPLPRRRRFGGDPPARERLLTPYFRTRPQVSALPLISCIAASPSFFTPLV
jgi:hypothetical protein